MLVGSCFSLTLPDKPDSRIIDLTNTLSSEQLTKINSRLDNIYKTESKTEIQVVLINTLDGEPIEDLSLDIARKWHLGSKEYNNGLLLLISKKEQKVRIDVGYGLEGVLPDGLIGQIEGNAIKPLVIQNNYYLAIESGITNLNHYILTDYQKTHPITTSSPGISTFDIFIIIVCIIGFITIIGVFTGNWDLAFDILLYLLNFIFIILGKGKDSDSSIGGGGGFGGGGSTR